MIYFPFDNASETNLDRNVNSDVYADYMQSYFSNGVHLMSNSNAFLVQAGTGMQVKVSAGKAVINGRFCKEENERLLTIQASDRDLDRIDNVVLRLDLDARSIDLYIVKGIAGTQPQAPTLTRNASVYELKIAQIYIPRLSTSVTNDKITDTRLNSEVCGIITSTTKQVDTTNIFNQYQTALSSYLEIVSQAINGTAYGELDNKITNLENSNEQFKQEINSMFYSLSNNMTDQMNTINTQLTQTANEAKFVRTNPINVPISLWQTHTDSLNRGRYKFKANVPISGMKESYYVNVLFKDVDWVNENIAMEVYSKNGSVEIYSATVPDEPVEILSIVYWR